MEKDKLLAYAIKYEGDYKRIKKAFENNESYESLKYEGKYITILDDEYPKELLDLDCPPYVLFYKGDINLLKTDKIAVVGSRECSNYGVLTTQMICEKLKDKCTLVSGMAKGIDSTVHISVLNSGATIGVLGCGIDYIYPYENLKLYKAMEERQLIISEYPGMVKPFKYHFPFRNRIIAALGEVTIVTEANLKSGTFITVNEALNLDREIYVVPYPLLDKPSGCNYLIQQGANIIYEKEVIEKIGKLFDKN